MLKSEFFHQPILERAKLVFNSAFRLRRMSEDDLNAEVSGRSLELGLQIMIVLGRCTVHFVGAEFVEIDAHRFAVFLYVFLPKREDGKYPLMVGKASVNNLARGIIHGQEQAAGVGSIFKPVFV